MSNYPEFFNVRKLMLILAVSPFAFLSVVILTEFSTHVFVQQKTADASCASTSLTKSATNIQASECR